MMQQIPASQQVEQLKASLLQLLVEKDDAEQKVKQADESIKAIRNVLAGLSLGEQLAAEKAGSAETKEALAIP